MLASLNGTKVGPPPDRTQPGSLDVDGCGLATTLKSSPQAARACPQWPHPTPPAPLAMLLTAQCSQGQTEGPD